jgi:hypothetical protein
MPLSIDFTARLQAKAFQKKPEPFWITVNEHFKVLLIFPLAGSYEIMQAALESDYLSPKDKKFWQGQELPRSGPTSEIFAQHANEFCAKYVSLQLISPQALQVDGIIEIQVKDLNHKRQPIKFRGVVTQIIPT